MDNKISQPVLKAHGRKLIIKEVLCRHCLRNGDIKKAFELYDRYKENVHILAGYIIEVRDEILERPMPISRVLSCEEGHREIYKKIYGRDWKKYYTKFSGHLYGIAVDFLFYNSTERSRLECELPSLNSIKRFGFTTKSRGKFHFDLWGLSGFQERYLPDWKKISKIQTWFY